jgi:hypothetical protein
MPGERLEIEAVATGTQSRFSAGCAAGMVTPLENDRWEWIAPEKSGAYCVSITDQMTGETICITVFVLVPYDGGEYLNGYRIGQYQQPLNGDGAYARPRGFIEVWPDDVERWVSPHFRLKQFLCKQEGDWPKYLVLQTRLLLKLEKLLEVFARRGYGSGTFYVTSGFRTPYYNELIGNDTRFSRHTYGDAADIFIDRNGNGMMDDLDRNGKVDGEDAMVLFKLVDQLESQSWYRPFIGGLGLYPPTSERGPFIHVDTRGHRARWTGSEPDSTSDSLSVDSLAVRDSLKSTRTKDSTLGADKPSKDTARPRRKVRYPLDDSELDTAPPIAPASPDAPAENNVEEPSNNSIPPPSGLR